MQVLQGETVPLSVDGAIALAALQCQSEVGDYTEEDHRALAASKRYSRFLPPHAELHVASLPLRIEQQHKLLLGLSGTDAKYAYVATVRALNPRGMSTFRIKEEITGEKRLVFRIFGITADSVMRIDEKTLRVLQVWSITTIVFWRSSEISLHLNTGGDSGDYFAKTEEGHAICRLLSFYARLVQRGLLGACRR
eukprot:Opistho-2@84301